ncbi:alpha/beta hydrolase [Paucihalobacter sp.]|uniref:alpha/beta hydrolase n=1 Tax=Paucihalobacter sp. TaxID=2850405 RepID=UPI002FDF682A
MKKIFKRLILIVVILLVTIFAVFKLSPYPSVWLIRYGFDKEAIKVNAALEQQVPDGIETINNIQYDISDNDAFLDVYFHNDSITSKKQLPVIVWTHGGGLISGDKSQISNYCKILASKGFVVISIDYTIAPAGKYPKPIQQLNKALAFISANAKNLHADTSFFILAGDSAGSMIASATANIITNPDYAKITQVEPGLEPQQLKGLLLYCGIYNIDNTSTEGAFGTFLETVKWVYFGKKDITDDNYANTAFVTNFLTSGFPPTFISAGNEDPLLPQSKLLAGKLSALNVSIDTLFFPKNHVPALGHEYQFTLDDSGEMALKRSVEFIQSLKNSTETSETNGR